MASKVENVVGVVLPIVETEIFTPKDESDFDDDDELVTL